MIEKTITIVSGLPRSGTSLMMQMLEGGGLEVVSDFIRAADEDNPAGYYEYEQVKKLKDNPDMLEIARGKVIKIISDLLIHVPRRYQCRVVFMRRHMGEILASQQQMLVRRGKPTDTISDVEMAALFERHLQKMEQWIEQQPHMRVHYVSYNDLVVQPAAHIDQINYFLGNRLDTEQMARAIDKRLYRQRST